MTSEGLTAVTIFYDLDVEYMELQARSVALYVEPGLFSKIILIDNTPGGGSGSHAARLKQAFGRHAALVEVYDAAEVYAIPPMEGWMAQQVLKLSISRLVETPQYVLFDAKNHWLRPISRDVFYAESGLPYLDSENYVGHPLREFLLRALGYFGLQDPRYQETFYQTITPFVMDKDVVQDLIAHMEAKSGRSFAEVMRDGWLTEFFTYEAFICWRHGSIEARYAVRPLPATAVSDVVWPESNDEGTIERILRDLEARQHPMFSFHRRAGKGLSGRSRRLLADFWIRHGLLADRSAAWRFFAVQRAKLWGETLGRFRTRAVRKLRKTLLGARG